MSTIVITKYCEGEFITIMNKIKKDSIRFHKLVVANADWVIKKDPKDQSEKKVRHT